MTLIRTFVPALALILTACAVAAFSGLIRADAQTDAPETAKTVNDLPLERLFQSPSLSGPTPRALKFSPDGTKVSFLKPREDDASRLDLWAFDVATGEASLLVDSTLLEPDDFVLSEQEKALRERQRTAGQRGILRYDWGSAETILVPLGGDLHLITLTETGPETRQLTATDAFEFDAKVSPGGKYVSFIRDNALFAIELETGQEAQLTPDANPGAAISYGVAEFVAQEEMSRYTGYWWSPDDQYIAYTRVDESTVDIVPRFDIAADKVTVIEQRYPRAGRPNAVVDLFVRDMTTGEATEVSWRREGWGPATDQYLNVVDWNGDFLTIQAMNRDQTQMKYLSSTAEGGWAPADDITIEQPNWINLSGRYRYLSQAELSIMTREDSGYRHIWVKSGDDDWSQLTSGDWVVDARLGTDVAETLTYFTGYKDTPLERHLYSVPLSGGEPRRITEEGSSWSVTMAPDGQSFIGTSSNPNQPPQVGLYRADGKLITWIEENALDADHPYAPYLEKHTAPEFGTLTAEDGQTLHYSIQFPPNFESREQYPVVVDVY
ncbi:MAG: DPP IV N-terminal domain-containing protein, partial [Pseudomonadota bacterium]